MKQDRKCNLCGFVIHGNDPLYNQRKKRHEEIHKKGRHEGRNNVKGTVIWLAVW